MKRLLSGLLSLTMVFSLTPSTIALADDEQTETTPQLEENGTTGSDVEGTTNGVTTTESGDTTGQNGGEKRPLNLVTKVKQVRVIRKRKNLMMAKMR